MDAGHFRSNSPPVIHETVEGETIIVNLETGSYYDLNHLGGSIFEGLAAGMPVAHLTDAIASAYQIERAAAARVVEDFAAQLVEEQLILPGENGAPAAPDAPELPASFAEPALKKYTDMQALLLLDPVHEVDEAGWPSRV